MSPRRISCSTLGLEHAARSTEHRLGRSRQPGSASPSSFSICAGSVEAHVNRRQAPVLETCRPVRTGSPPLDPSSHDLLDRSFDRGLGPASDLSSHRIQASSPPADAARRLEKDDRPCESVPCRIFVVASPPRRPPEAAPDSDAAARLLFQWGHRARHAREKPTRAGALWFRLLVSGTDGTGDPLFSSLHVVLPSYLPPAAGDEGDGLPSRDRLSVAPVRAARRVRREVATQKR